MYTMVLLLLFHFELFTFVDAIDTQSFLPIEVTAESFSIRETVNLVREIQLTFFTLGEWDLRSAIYGAVASNLL